MSKMFMQEDVALGWRCYFCCLFAAGKITVLDGAPRFGIL